MSVDSVNTISLTISWTLDDSVTVTSYTISYSNTNTDCFNDSDNITDITASDTMYNLTDLEEGTEYSITVTALLSDGGTAVDNLTAITTATGLLKLPISSVSLILNLSPPAPSAAPTSVSVSAVTSSSITVQWGAVDCIHRNGDITGYSVRYGEVGSAEGDRSVEMVSGGSVTLTSLMPSTTYSIEVAAVNTLGIGLHSDVFFNVTEGIALFSLVSRPMEGLGMRLSNILHVSFSCKCLLYFQLKLHIFQLTSQQQPPSPSTGLVLVQRWMSMR